MRERLGRTLRAPALHAAVGGALVGLSAPPFPPALIALSFLGAVLLAGALDETRVGRAMLRGLAFGTVANLIAMSFVPATITRFTDLPTAAALLALLLLAIGQGAAYAVTGLVTAVGRRLGAPLAVAFPLGLGATFAVPQLFPWTIAAPLARAPIFLQLAEVVGERGVAVLLAVSAALAARAFVESGRARTRRAVASFAIPMALFAYGAVRARMVDATLATAKRTSIALVQQAVPPKERWRPEAAPSIVTRLWSLTKLAQERGAELAVWPESAYPYVMPHAAGVEKGPFRVRGPGVRIDVMTGLLTPAPSPPGDPDPAAKWHYNATTLVDADGNVAKPSAKLALLAFGEVVPFGDWFPWLRKTFARGGGLRPGEEVVLLETRHGVRAGVLNCYEDTLPFVARQVAAASPNLLVNVTNDAWFGETAEPELHLLEAIPRAIETRRDMVRAVNTGVTAHVDAVGRVVARAEREIQTFLLVTPALLDSGPTPYVRLGDASWLLPLAMAAIAFIVRARRA